MKEITPTREMIEQAESLGEGKILIVYRDYNAIRMETERGRDPYVWRSNRWRLMRLPQFIPMKLRR